MVENARNKEIVNKAKRDTGVIPVPRLILQYPKQIFSAKWSDQAKCRKPGAPDMYPAKEEEQQALKPFCKDCPVLLECLSEGLGMSYAKQSGVWGGKTELERRRMLRFKGTNVTLFRADVQQAREYQELLHAGKVSSSSQRDTENELLDAEKARVPSSHISYPDTTLSSIFARRTVENALLTTDKFIERFKRLQGGHVDWANVPIDIIRDLLVRAGDEIGIPASMFTQPKFSHQYDFLGKLSLLNLYRYAEKAVANKDTNVVTQLCEALVLQPTTNDVIKTKRKNGRITWERISNDTLRELIEKASLELGIPVSLFGPTAMQKDLKFYGGKSLQDIYNYFRSLSKETGVNAVSLMRQTLDIPKPTTEEVVQALSSGTQIMWDYVPSYVVGELLEVTAIDQGITPNEIEADHLLKGHDVFFGHSLSGLLNNKTKKLRRGKKDKIAFIFEEAGLKRMATLKTLLQKFNSGRDTVRIDWEKIPNNVIRELLVRFAEAINIPVNELSAEDLIQNKVDFLGDHSLLSLVRFASKQKDEGESRIAYLKRRAEIEITETIAA